MNQLIDDFVEKIWLLDENEHNRQIGRERAERYNVTTVVLYFGFDDVHRGAAFLWHIFIRMCHIL